MVLLVASLFPYPYIVLCAVPSFAAASSPHISWSFFDPFSTRLCDGLFVGRCGASVLRRPRFESRSQLRCV